MIACVRCGRIDGSLRIAYYRWVVSVLLLSFRRTAGGVLCAGCRRTTNLSCSVLTATAGWWGIPWGLFWTPAAIFRNVRGGERVAASGNSALLGVLSAQLRERGEAVASTEAYNTALALDPEAARQAAAQPAETTAAILVAAPTRTSKGADLGRALGALGVVVVAIALALSPQSPASASTDLVLDAPPASYVGNSVSVSGTIRNQSNRTATSVWVELVVTDSSTGREIARGRTPSSAPQSDVTIAAHGAAPFSVSVTLPAAPDRIKVEKFLHWR